MNKKLLILSGSALALSLLVSGSALAASKNFEGMAREKGIKEGARNYHAEMHSVTGTVSSVNGTSISLAARNGTAYTIDATNAVVMKNNATSTISNIAVGDMLNVQGNASGTSVVASKIRDIVKNNLNVPMQIQGNGQPVVAGKVTSINGLTLAITNSSNVSYTIDATNAKIQKAGNASSTISSIAVGDNVIAQGTINGTSVIAASVIDQTNATVTNNGNEAKTHSSFFGSVGNFFKHLFGF